MPVGAKQAQLNGSAPPPHNSRCASIGKWPNEIPFESALALERELQQQLFQSEDAGEGLAAYNEKRKAQFRGK